MPRGHLDYKSQEFVRNIQEFLPGQNFADLHSSSKSVGSLAPARVRVALLPVEAKVLRWL